MSKAYPIVTMVCTECGNAYQGGKGSFFCPECRHRRMRESCQKRNLHQLGADARARKRAEKEASSRE